MMQSQRRFNVAFSVFGLAALLVVAAMTGSGCKHSQKGTSDALQIPDDLQITVGQTGGLAGRMSGYALDAAGTVVAWEGKFPRETVRAESDPSSERAATLWKEASDAGILAMSQQAMATATWFVTVAANGESRKVSWAEWPSDPGAFNDAQRFYNSFMQVAKEALGESID